MVEPFLRHIVHCANIYNDVAGFQDCRVTGP